MGDYIKLDRKIIDWEWYQDINTCRVFIHFLLKANWKEAKFKGYTVPRGSFVSSYPVLQNETRLTEREIRTAILHLKTTGELTTKSTNKFTIFTVCNYDLYQSDRQTNDIQATDKRHSNDILTSAIEEKKEVKNKKNKDILCPSQDIIDYLNDLAGTSFKTSTSSTQKLISARCKEGFTLDDFKLVINKKVTEWRGTDMAKYIRPATLFGTKFESYKNQLPAVKKIEFNSFEQNDYDFKQLEKDIVSN